MSAWDKFWEGTKNGWKNTNADDTPRSGDYDSIRRRSLGYNDFLKGSMYGPLTEETVDDKPDYEKRREAWNLRNPEISDDAVVQERAKRQQQQQEKVAASQAPSVATSTVAMVMPSMTSAATTSVQTGASAPKTPTTIAYTPDSSPRISRLKAQLVQSEMEAWRGGTTAQQQAANIRRRNDLKAKIEATQAKEREKAAQKIETQRQAAAPATRAPANDLRERMLSLRANATPATPQAPQTRTPDQQAADVGEQPRASRRGLSAVTNPANEFAGILGTGAPVSASALKDLYDRAQASKANRKAASVGEQPLSGNVGPNGKNVTADVTWVQDALMHERMVDPQRRARIIWCNVRVGEFVHTTEGAPTAHAKKIRNRLRGRHADRRCNLHRQRCAGH